MDIGARPPVEPCEEESVPVLASPLATHADLGELERVTIQRVFQQVHGDKTQAGKMLGISRATLYRKLKRFNIAVGRGGGCVRSHPIQNAETSRSVPPAS